YSPGGPYCARSASSIAAQSRIWLSYERRPCWSLQRASTYIASPSLSQRSFQLSGVTVSPIHWCAYSWASTARYSSFGGRAEAPSVTSVCVSIPDIDGTTTTPALSNGYGPSSPSSHSSSSGDSSSRGSS